MFPQLRPLRVAGKSGAFGNYISNVLSLSPLAFWPLNEAAGRVADDLIGSTALIDLLYLNGGFETSGAGGADVWAYWVESASDGAIADETTIVHSGSHAAKITRGVTDLCRINLPSLFVLPGASIIFTFWTRGDGTNAGRYAVFDETNGVFIRSLITTGVTGTTYTQVNYSFTVPAGCYSIRVDFWAPSTVGGVAYFDDAALTWTRPMDGWYPAAGVTYGQDGPMAGTKSVAVTGSSTYCLIGNPAFNTIFPSNVGSAIMWGKVDSAARWTDATEFRYLFHPKSRTAGTVYVVFGKNTTNHTLFWRRRINSSIHEITHTFSPSGTLDWFCQGMVWDVVSSPKRIACFLYADGVFTTVSDVAPSAGYGDQLWDTNTYPVDDSNCLLLAGGTASQEWIGNGALCVLWNRALSTAEMRNVMMG